ncbi:N-acetyltransferase [Hoyosella rhizosphaerae]|uniref:N-acetyltransferase n=1 Tax=Hoyosella rhizosphaerae TaxID=1755582 RepID=A0A916X9I5_9ACTN|nr:GNAT family N-acetyltransferase [Hoyosella rhizosphaerae]MBN4927148.1 N-acetyltransferase [Hoyosella rhizosphaerae]GGC53611.1 N-acetyltransferase [Hoyosella rhizosphaerae]
MTFEFRDNGKRERFELTDGDAVAGFAEYSILQDRMSLTHTEVDRQYGGQGVGSILLKKVLDTARERGMTVLPSCPFAQSFIRKNPEYADLVPSQLHGRFGLTTQG